MIKKLEDKICSWKKENNINDKALGGGIVFFVCFWIVLDKNDNNICDFDENINSKTESDEFESDDFFDEIKDDLNHEFEEDGFGDLLDEDIKHIEEYEEEIQKKFDKLEDEFNMEIDHFENNFYQVDRLSVFLNYESGKLEANWEGLEKFEDFKYYKFLISSTDSDVKYPETSAKFVGQSIYDTETSIPLYKLDKGINYVRVGYVLADDSVEHTEVLKINIE